MNQSTKTSAMRNIKPALTTQTDSSQNLVLRLAKIMKSPLKNLLFFSVILCGLLGSTLRGYADVTVKVDSTQQWLGYMNVWQTNGTGYEFGNAWATADLRGAFVPTNSPSGWPLNTALVLRPNTNTYNPTNIYWNNPDGSPTKVLEANFYRDVFTNYGGQTVTFTGTLLSNTIPGLVDGHPATGWEVLAVVKEFTAPAYGWVGMNSVPLTAPGPFTVSRAIPAGGICQYGFIVKGPNTAPGSANSLTGVGILVEDSDPAITNQPANVTITTGVTTNLTVGAIGSGPLAYQWKTNGVNLVNGAKFSGVTSPTLTINNGQVADSGSYVVTVSNTVTLATVDSNPARLTVLDVLITNSPVDQRVEQGSTVVFTVGATSSSSLGYTWRSVINGVTNFALGPNVSGTFTPTLTLSNVQPTASGFYFVTITAGTGQARAGATLLVKSYANYANFLENPGFENDPTGVDESPWHRFEVTDPGTFGHFQSTNDTYFGGGTVNVHEGTWVSYTTYNGAYSGIYQDVAASPGQIFTADMWFYNATGDPIPGPDLLSTNENYLEIQFRAGADPTPIRQYLTTITNLDYTAPRDVWFQLQATNAGTYGFNPATNNTRYLVAPPGTTSVRFQVTMHDVANSTGYGSIYYDSARLMLKLPVTVNVSRAGGNTVLSWKSQGATDYQVQYKDTLEGAWQNLGGVVNGTGLVISKSDSTPDTKRFYRVLTL
jgi:hypothetical protein